MKEAQPLIGITMRHDLETDRFYLARGYSEAVEAQCGVPLHLALIPHREYIAAALTHLDGVLLPGSASDVDPLRYGHEPHRLLGAVHPLRDETDALVLAEVERRRMPLLAICFGMQIWNVVRGGTLVQDIHGQLPEAIKHQQGAPRDRRSHPVRLLTGSVVADLAGRESAVVNSHHHQAVATVGHGLRATGWTADGLIEAVEEMCEDNRFALGVQWHPEIDWESDKFATSMFKRFVEAARDYKRAREHGSSAPEKSEG